MSLMKLYNHRALTEPSLEKRVLINNMLRRIQDELKQEGNLRPLFFPPSPPPDDPVTRDSFSSALDEIEELCPSPLPTATSVPGATSLSSLTLTLQMPLCPPSLNSGALDSKDCSSAAPNAPETLPPNSLDMSTSPSASSSGFLTDLALDDILFADIDTSMYDFDPCTSSSGAAPSKLAPMVTADELLKTLSPYSGSAPAVSSNQPFKMDLTELDHIMEVLVGS
ncbi:hypothetical protein PO909_019356 [Leuciscus waleckii]